jgi:integral membrane sensor domain MASE1
MGKLRLHIFLFFLLVGVTFSPLVIPEGVDTPWLFGMPRTLWAGILVSLCLLGLTLASAIKLIKDSKHETKD